MLASRPNGTLYVGVTNDLMRRLDEHARGEGCAFTARYGVKTLVWFETHDRVVEAIAREKRIKRWRRDWKKALIAETNPHWLPVPPPNT